jgi:hypothetical protein
MYHGDLKKKKVILAKALHTERENKENVLKSLSKSQISEIPHFQSGQLCMLRL